MNNTTCLLEKLQKGDFDNIFCTLYGKESLEASKIRYESLISGFEKGFGHKGTWLFSAPGRTELGGNHTDHQHGCVLAASINLDMIACVGENEKGKIAIISEGYPILEVDLKELTPVEGEENTSNALVRGVAASFADLGVNYGSRGLDIYMTSNVLGGSGLSSSAAYEVLVGTIINELFWDGKETPVKIAQIGQYAENVFFKKPCGLMDQTASSVGSAVAIDFRDTKEPVVEKVEFDFANCGFALCIIDSGADHADLTHEYAAITNELKAVCSIFGKEVLRDIDKKDFLEKLVEVRKVAGDRGALRAFHFYSENERAIAQATALKNNDFQEFLRLVSLSGASSAMKLQNVVPTGSTFNQELMLTLALCEDLLKGRGAYRVHGGGFGGTAQAFVPCDMVSMFKEEMEKVLGEGSCHVLNIRPIGGICLGK